MLKSIFIYKSCLYHRSKKLPLKKWEFFSALLRVKAFRQYAEKTIINNVYMDLDMLCKTPQFKRTHSVIDREGIYTRVQRYKRRLQPDYDSGLCLETVRCIFTLPEGEAEKYKIIHDGQETYAFIMSNRYILGLFTHCEAARKSVVMDGVEFGHLAEQEQKIVLLDGVGDVLFQALLLDDVEYGGHGLSANLHTVYCFGKERYGIFQFISIANCQFCFYESCGRHWKNKNYILHYLPGDSAVVQVFSRNVTRRCLMQFIVLL